MKKAFDTEDHIPLFRMLGKARNRGVAESFKSSIKFIKFGVLQGLVLGTILFLIYIDDLFSGTYPGKRTVFADDKAPT